MASNAWVLLYISPSFKCDSWKCHEIDIEFQVDIDLDMGINQKTENKSKKVIFKSK